MKRIVLMIFLISMVSLVSAAEYKTCTIYATFYGPDTNYCSFTTQSNTRCDLNLENLWRANCNDKTGAIYYLSERYGMVSHNWFGNSYVHDKIGDNVFPVRPPYCLNESIFDVLGDIANYCVLENNGVEKAYNISDGFPLSAYNKKTSCDNTFCGDWRIYITAFDGSLDFRDLSENYFLLDNDITNKAQRHTYSTWVYINRTLTDVSYGVSVNHYSVFEIFYFNVTSRKLESIYIHTCEKMTCSNNILPRLEKGWYLLKDTYIGWDNDGNNMVQLNFYPRDSNDRPKLKEYFQIINSYGPLSQDGDIDEYNCESDPYLPYQTRHWKNGQSSQRNCCGDDIGDYGYVSTDGKICTQNGWEEVSDLCYIDGEYKQGTHFISELQRNNLASDGSDGCCGDDLPVCELNFTMPPLDFCYSYTNKNNCENIPSCRWNGTSCVLITPEYCSSFSYVECPRGCKVDKNNDLGYITPDGLYLCTNTSMHVIGGSGYKWVYAPENVFNATRAFIVNNKSSRIDKVDFISNSVNWSYCNASNIDLLGNPIKEYGSFKAKTPLTGDISCANFMNLLGYSFSTCGQNPTNCCVDMTITLSDISTISNCKCYNDNGDNFEVCSLSIAPLLPECNNQNPSLINTNLIEKSLCMFDFVNCMNQNFYDPNKNCAQQSPPGTLCNKEEQICVNGTIINAYNTPQDKFCCYGANTVESCMDINGVSDCSAVGGTVFNILSEECMAGFSYFKIDNNNYCCLGPVRQRTYDVLAFLSKVNNDSYICYNQNNNSYFGHCCYNNDCMYSYSFGQRSNYLSIFNSTLFYSGSALHTISDFDMYEGSRGVVVDYVYKYTSQSADIPILISNKINLSTFKYIEFSLAYSNKNVLGNILINNIDYGSVFDYIIGNNEAMRWHRVKIPIKDFQRNEVINTIKLIRTNSGELTVLVDNIILIPEHTSSLNYYCSAGFGKWLPDLDTNLTKHPFGDTFYTDINAWRNVGPYEHACDSVGGYYWTGHQCCGDDTKRENYGEFYNDTEAGCFNGTIIHDKKPVSYAFNVREIETPKDFESFIYKDLIYNNSIFISCQAAQTKYSNLKISYNGNLNTYPNTNQLSQLVTKNIAKECVIIGDYYCFNNAWRQNITGIGLLGKDYNGTLNIKNIPPQTNLIRNSDFGGECPENICGNIQT